MPDPLDGMVFEEVSVGSRGLFYFIVLSANPVYP